MPAHLLASAAHKVGPAIEGYTEDVPSAGMLFLDIARRRLGATEITRIQAFVEREFPVPVCREERPSLARLLTPDRVILHLTCPGLEDAIEIAASRLARSRGGPKVRRVVEEILAREQIASTALGGGVMVPHGVFPSATSSAALVTLARPFLLPEAPDAAPIRLLVVLVHGEPGRAHLALLAHVARLSSHGLGERLGAAKSPAEAIEAVFEMEGMG